MLLTSFSKHSVLIPRGQSVSAVTGGVEYFANFDIVMDHQSLTWLQGLKKPRGRLAQRILALQVNEFEINHRLGKQHSNADTLARFPRVTPSSALEEALKRR